MVSNGALWRPPAVFAVDRVWEVPFYVRVALDQGDVVEVVDLEMEFKSRLFGWVSDVRKLGDALEVSCDENQGRGRRNDAPSEPC